MNLHQNLKRLRKQNELSQKTLTEIISVSGQGDFE